MKDILTKILKVVLFALLFWIIVYGLRHYNNNSFKRETYTTSFKGKLDSKYVDENDHLRPKIKITNSDKTIIYDLANDESGLYEFVQKGDSVIKRSNSLNVRVSNSNNDTIFVLKF